MAGFANGEIGSGEPRAFTYVNGNVTYLNSYPILPMNCPRWLSSVCRA
jgi:hypothetical protein